MTRLLALCLEDLETSQPDRKYLQCVAVPGRQSGLTLDDRGSVLWRSEGDATCELWVTADGRLALWRREGGERVVLSRAHRTLDVPAGKPVMVVNKDEVAVGGRRLRVHIHGAASAPEAPKYFVSRSNRTTFRAAATAVVLGASLAATAAGSAQDSPPPIDVRDQPPAPPLIPETVSSSQPADPDGGASGEGMVGGDADVDADQDAAETDADVEPIEVREIPPAPVPPPPPPSGCCTHQPGAGVAWRARMKRKM